MRGGGGCWACFRSGPISVGGGGGSKRSAPLFPGPQEEPAHGLHPRFVVAEIWADRGPRGGGGGLAVPAPGASHRPGGSRPSPAPLYREPDSHAVPLWGPSSPGRCRAALAGRGWP